MTTIGYQAEIDNITKRTKYAENAFLTVYKLLADAPDPAPLFEIAVVKYLSVLYNEHLLIRQGNRTKALKWLIILHFKMKIVI